MNPRNETKQTQSQKESRRIGSESDITHQSQLLTLTRNGNSRAQWGGIRTYGIWIQLHEKRRGLQIPTDDIFFSLK